MVWSKYCQAWRIHWICGLGNMHKINSIEDLRLSLFAPIDEEYPIVEVLHKDDVLFDLSIDTSDPSSINILIHQAGKGVLYNLGIFEKILEKAKEKLTNAL